MGNKTADAVSSPHDTAAAEAEAGMR